MGVLTPYVYYLLSEHLCKYASRAVNLGKNARVQLYSTAVQWPAACKQIKPVLAV